MKTFILNNFDYFISNQPFRGAPYSVEGEDCAEYPLPLPIYIISQV